MGSSPYSGLRVALLPPLAESVPPKLYGGTERIVHQLCLGLTRAGVEVTLFGTGDSRTSGRLVPITEHATRLSPVPVCEPHAHTMRMMGVVARQSSSFDVIHNHYDYWMLPLSETVRPPFLTTLHNRMDLPEVRSAFREFPRARLISISDSQRRAAAELNWLATIRHGLDASAYRFHPRPGRYLAFLGRIAPDKRPDWAIEIARRSGVPLKIAAKIEGQAAREYYDAKVRPQVDGRFIEYVGEISEAEKSAFLGEALGLVFPIDWPEPFGLVMIEALACGTPVLSRPCGAVPEVLRDGVTGYVHADLGRLAKRVGDLPSLDRLGCRRWVEERFSLERMTEQYLEAYGRVLQPSSAPRSAA